MRWILPLFLSLMMFITSVPVKAMIPDMEAYVAIISSPDLAYYFTDFPKYKKDLLAKVYSWKGLPKLLEIVAQKSGSESIFLDFMVHGEDDGLYLHDPDSHKWKRATFGYIVNCITQAFPGRKDRGLF